jgi:uncharacterized glyoxalase superfamily protein PhnB
MPTLCMAGPRRPLPEIVFDIEDKPYGGPAFTCRDLEGRIWNIASYNPWLPK